MNHQLLYMPNKGHDDIISDTDDKHRGGINGDNNNL